MSSRKGKIKLSPDQRIKVQEMISNISLIKENKGSPEADNLLDKVALVYGLTLNPDLQNLYDTSPEDYKSVIAAGIIDGFKESGIKNSKKISKLELSELAKDFQNMLDGKAKYS